MIQLNDFPYAQFREAFGTIFGRIGLIILAVLLGSMIGGISATRSLEGLLLGIVGLPHLSLASIFFGVGLVVLPALLLYAIASIRYEWPIRLTLICAFLMWWNIHKTIRWTVYDSPAAQRTEEFQAELEEALHEAFERANKKKQGDP